MKEDISVQVEYDGIDATGFGMASTLLGDMDAKFTDIILYFAFISI